MTRTTADEARRYLLGQLPDDESMALEREYFADPARVDALAAAESDLVDAYVAGELPAAERTAFESHYLASPVHRERVETARLLAAAAARSAAARRPVVLWLGLAAAAIAAFIFYSSRPPSRPDPQVASVPSATPMATTPTPAATPAVAPSTPKRTIALALASVRVRGEQATPELRLPPSADEVALELEGAGGLPAGPLSFSVRTVEGRRVASGRVERRGGSSLGIARVAAARLAPDDYIVAVSAAGEPPGAQYFFRITPAP